MGEIRYIISDASKKLNVEQHTLRYWEEELGLHILRNEMGHRYYREEDIETLKVIKALKEKGYQLRGIKMVLSHIQNIKNFDINKLDMLQNDLDYDESCFEKEEGESNESDSDFIPLEIPNSNREDQHISVESSSDRLNQFKEIMGDLISEALQENSEDVSELISEAVSNSVIKQMDYLLRMKEEREEERFKRFDKALREIQTSRAEYAATKTVKKKNKFFKK